METPLSVAEEQTLVIISKAEKTFVRFTGIQQDKPQKYILAVGEDMTRLHRDVVDSLKYKGYLVVLNKNTDGESFLELSDLGHQYLKEHHEPAVLRRQDTH